MTDEQSTPETNEEPEVDDFEFPRDRDRDMAERPLSPVSLCGSYFRCPDQADPNAEASWLDHEVCATQEGMVVAQPFASGQTIYYLVEFYGAHGASGFQQIVSIDRMQKQRWAFYDTEAWLTSRPREEVRSDERDR
jgi:hypothetical protein